MTRPTSYAIGDGPGLSAWDLAHERLAAKDAERSAELARYCDIRPRGPRTACKTEGCKRAATIKGLCGSCYQREWKAKAREQERREAMDRLAKSSSPAARAMVGG